MPDAFHQHIRAALADPVLQSALDTNAERRVKARLQAMATLPGDANALRRRAHAIRAQTLANLDSYLAQFIQNTQANGFTIHRAADAEQAIQIVLRIAQEHNNRVIAKSKTMVSEEIELNRALEQAGLHPVETDLGEFIVQLRGERPAHLITPAVHLRRAEVGQTFHEKLGIPLSDDIPTLIAAARQILRQTFLEAGVGISGVNFGVCQTGSICLVSNEGNGRMVTTLPPVHIALMGIERLVPDLDDLALLLSLLARSATGQKMTVYTTLIHSPRQPGDPDGPEVRHLILLDNGREAVRHSPLGEALLCIRCGACLNACPVFREIGGHAYVDRAGQGTPYSGPIGSVLSPGLFGQREFGQLARASTLCGACQEACPVDIDLPGLLLRVRAGGIELGSPHPERRVPPAVALGLQAYTWIASNPRRFHLAQRLAGLFSRLVAPRSGWMRLPAFTGWGTSKDFPRPALHPFREDWASGRQVQEIGE
ncbi:MAG TPA: lactate utilization protein B, partial [Anaerolineales bacterium]|nr:lactate utilization protein B [Anaerolineales bacterium]